MFEEEKNGKNIVFAIVLSLVVIIGWPILFPQPEMKKQVVNNIENSSMPVPVLKKTHEEAVKSDLQKVNIVSKDVTGSISLKGAVFNNAVLSGYNKELNSDDKIVLLSHQNTHYPYFLYTGWVGSKNIDFPTNDTV